MCEMLVIFFQTDYKSGELTPPHTSLSSFKSFLSPSSGHFLPVHVLYRPFGNKEFKISILHYRFSTSAGPTEVGLQQAPGFLQQWK